MILTIELPENLNRQVREQQIPEKEINAVLLKVLELWLAEQPAAKAGRFAESAVPFTERLIAQNRELFQLLSQR